MEFFRLGYVDRRVKESAYVPFAFIAVTKDCALAFARKQVSVEMKLPHSVGLTVDGAVAELVEISHKCRGDMPHRVSQALDRLTNGFTSLVSVRVGSGECRNQDDMYLSALVGYRLVDSEFRRALSTIGEPLGEILVQFNRNSVTQKDIPANLAA